MAERMGFEPTANLPAYMVMYLVRVVCGQGCAHQSVLNAQRVNTTGGPQKHEQHHSFPALPQAHGQHRHLHPLHAVGRIKGVHKLHLGAGSGRSQPAAPDAEHCGVYTRKILVRETGMTTVLSCLCCLTALIAPLLARSRSPLAPPKEDKEARHAYSAARQSKTKRAIGQADRDARVQPGAKPCSRCGQMGMPSPPGMLPAQCGKTYDKPGGGSMICTGTFGAKQTGSWSKNWGPGGPAREPQVLTAAQAHFKPCNRCVMLGEPPGQHKESGAQTQRSSRPLQWQLRRQGVQAARAAQEGLNAVRTHAWHGCIYCVILHRPRAACASVPRHAARTSRATRPAVPRGARGRAAAAVRRQARHATFCCAPLFLRRLSPARNQSLEEAAHEGG
jgi:hypothetical protein